MGAAAHAAIGPAVPGWEPLPRRRANNAGASGAPMRARHRQQPSDSAAAVRRRDRMQRCRSLPIMPAHHLAVCPDDDSDSALMMTATAHWLR